jgi:CelD/BcsL family acetyltransferase involved in cellulose biosynthesis
MHELGLADSFSAPGTRALIEAAATQGLSQARPAIELYACSVGDQIVATYGVVGGGRFCGVFNSMIRGELARKSPGSAADDRSRVDVLPAGTHPVRPWCGRSAL